MKTVTLTASGLSLWSIHLTATDDGKRWIIAEIRGRIAGEDVLVTPPFADLPRHGTLRSAKIRLEKLGIGPSEASLDFCGMIPHEKI